MYVIQDISAVYNCLHTHDFPWSIIPIYDPELSTLPPVIATMNTIMI